MPFPTSMEGGWAQQKSFSTPRDDSHVGAARRRQDIAASDMASSDIIALGNSGTGKTHVALALGLTACQKGFSVTFTTAAWLVNQLLEAC